MSGSEHLKKETERTEDSICLYSTVWEQTNKHKKKIKFYFKTCFNEEVCCILRSLGSYVLCCDTYPAVKLVKLDQDQKR